MTTNTDMIDALASADPTPGGGAASAYVGALATSLASMVGNLTVGKKSYAAVEADVAASLERLASLRERLLDLVDADERAFQPLAAVYRMPKETSEEAHARSVALQKALIGACDVPLAVMRACVDVIRECDFLAHNGTTLAISDAGAAVAFARAALYSASLNVYINIASMADENRAAAYRDETDGIIEEGSEAADAAYAYVADQIGALY